MAPQPTTSNTSVPKRHPEYFFQEADVTFRVEDVVFRVHRRFFLRESQYFRTMFTGPNVPCNDPPGSSETNPIVLKDTSSEAFTKFLWVFYNPKYSIYTTSVENWTKILVLAQRWGFKEVEQLCIRELENLSIPPVEKIQIYQEFRIDRSRLLSSFAALTSRPNPLSLEEGQKVGLETALQIARARELSRGAHAKPSAVLNEAELRSVIRDTFELEDDFVDFSTVSNPPPPPPQPQPQPNPPANDRRKKSGS